jgi:TPR repeat protein
MALTPIGQSSFVPYERPPVTKVQRVEQAVEDHPEVASLKSEIVTREASIRYLSIEELGRQRASFDGAFGRLSKESHIDENSQKTLRNFLKKTGGLAEGLLGELYLIGDRVTKDIDRAFPMFLDGLAQDDYLSAIYLVYLFSLKSSEHFSLEKAKYCLQIVIESDRENELFEKAKRLFSNGQNSESLNFLALVSDAMLLKQNQEARCFLAKIELIGCDVCPQNKERGLEKMTLLAKEGNTDAIVFLVTCPTDTPKDEDALIGLFEEISLDPNTTGENRKVALGFMVSKTAENPLKHSFYSCLRNFMNSEPHQVDHLYLMAKEIFRSMPREYFPKARRLNNAAIDLRKEVFAFYPKIDREHQKPFAMRYLFGTQAEGDLPRAFAYFLDGMTQGLIGSTICLGYVYSLKNSPYYSPQKAQDCYLESKDQAPEVTLFKNASFFFNFASYRIDLTYPYFMFSGLQDPIYAVKKHYYLGRIEEIGCEGCPQNKESGLKKIISAAEGGDLDAILFLARRYSSEPGKIGQAYRIYCLGMQKGSVIAKYEAALLILSLDRDKAVQLFKQVILSSKATGKMIKDAVKQISQHGRLIQNDKEFLNKITIGLSLYQERKDILFYIANQAFIYLPIEFRGYAINLLRAAQKLGSVEAMKYFDRSEGSNIENDDTIITY